MGGPGGHRGAQDHHGVCGLRCAAVVVPVAPTDELSSSTRSSSSLASQLDVIVGVVLVIAFFTALSGVWGWIALIVGIVLLATAALGTCPPYSLLGINTCKVKSE